MGLGIVRHYSILQGDRKVDKTTDKTTTVSDPLWGGRVKITRNKSGVGESMTLKNEVLEEWSKFVAEKFKGTELV